MNYLFILNDHPHETERDYNALRLATSLAVNAENTVHLFLLGDGVCAAVRGQSTPEGKHDIEWMLKRLAAGGTQAGVCRTCMEARGIAPGALADGAYQSTLEELSRWTEEADKVLVF